MDLAEELRRHMSVLGRIDGVGVDVEAVERFSAPDLRIFSPAEIAYCQAQATPAESFAGRWCAKEAVVKALSARSVISPRNVSITQTDGGSPQATVSGSDCPHLTLVSISHSARVAVAVAFVRFLDLPG